MALRFNGLSPTGANPFSAMCTSQIGFTSGAVANTANLTTQWGRGERHAVKTSFGEYASNPPPSESPVAWTLAGKGGDLAAENSINQGNTLTLVSLSLGKDLAATLTQDGSLTEAALSMIASMSANMQQEGQLTGGMQMTLNLAADLVQDGQIDAALGLIAWCQASLAQDNSMSASNLRGEMNMAANIVSYGELTPEGLRDAVWGKILEAGYTAEEIMRLLASVAAGDASGLEGATPVFRDLADTKDRITATYSGGAREVTSVDVS